MYRPTVRMDERFREYVNDVFHATGLDRNQIIRLMMFSAPFSGIFRSKVDQHLKKELKECPAPKWQPKESELWKEQGE